MSATASLVYSRESSIVPSREGSLSSKGERSSVSRQGELSIASSKDVTQSFKKGPSPVSSSHESLPPRKKESREGSVVTTGSARSMDRLALPKRQVMLAGEKNFLPSGDCLPSWYNMSLIQKLPMFPAPNGVLDICANKLAHPVRKHLILHECFMLTSWKFDCIVIVNSTISNQLCINVCTTYNLQYGQFTSPLATAWS